jgi:hypothetical protein
MDVIACADAIGIDTVDAEIAATGWREHLPWRVAGNVRRRGTSPPYLRASTQRVDSSVDRVGERGDDSATHHQY